jgi:hypothetical protein
MWFVHLLSHDVPDVGNEWKVVGPEYGQGLSPGLLFSITENVLGVDDHVSQQKKMIISMCRSVIMICRGLRNIGNPNWSNVSVASPNDSKHSQSWMDVSGGSDGS